MKVLIAILFVTTLICGCIKDTPHSEKSTVGMIAKSAPAQQSVAWVPLPKGTRLVVVPSYSGPGKLVPGKYIIEGKEGVTVSVPRGNGSPLITNELQKYDREKRRWVTYYSW